MTFCFIIIRSLELDLSLEFKKLAVVQKINAVIVVNKLFTKSRLTNPNVVTNVSAK